MKNKTKTYLIYVRYALSGTCIYKIKTNDIYHVIGKLYCKSIEQIECIIYNIYTETREEFWKTAGYSIITLTKEWL